MDEEININIIEEEYNSFRDNLRKDLFNNESFIKNNYCYLVNKSWVDELKNCFKYYRNINNLCLPKNNLHFINDISTVIKCLKKNKKFKLISEKLINIIYNDEFNNNSLVEYYAANNNLIIEFKNEKYSLLIQGPLGDYQIEENLFLVRLDQKNINDLCQDLLIYNNFDEYEQNGNIIPIIKFMNINSENKIKNNDYLNIIKKDLLKILIYIYYFEKLLLENKKEIIKDYQEYYLINPDWMNKYKDYYNYRKIYEHLKQISDSNINYYNLDTYIDSIIDSELTIDILNFEHIKLTKDLLDIKFIKVPKCKMKDITFYNNCYFLPFKIISMIENYEYNNKSFLISIEKRKLLVKEDILFLFHHKGVEIGRINKQAVFIQKYIFVFNREDIFKSEKQFLISQPVEEYIKKKKKDVKKIIMIFNIYTMKIII